MASSIYELYGDLWGTGTPGLSEDVGKSLKPRSADWLYRAFAQCGVSPNHLVLDVGSRDAGHAIELAKRFGKGVGFAIGLLIFPFICFPILGFGSAQYHA